MPKIGAIEVFFIELIFFLGLWVMNSYVATLLTTIFVPICFFLLVIAWISERIEPSKVPKLYFTLMLVSFLAPLVAAGLMWALEGIA